MDRKALVREYREVPRPAGVCRIVHLPSRRTLLGASPNAPAMLNRIRAQLTMGSHTNRRMQTDWDADGERGFEFEVLDLLPPSDNPDEDVREDLQTLLDLWRDNLGIEPGISY